MQRDKGGNYHLSLSGADHFSIGVRHGEALTEVIDTALARFRAWLDSRFEMSAERFIGRVVSESAYLDAWKQHAPHLVDELHGISDGAGQEFDHLFAFNLLEELLDYDPGKPGGQSSAPAHCTTFAIAGQRGKQSILAENMDWADYFDGAQTVFLVQYPKSELQLLMYGFAGTVSGIGVSNYGTGVAVNTILNTQVRTRNEGGITCMATQRLLLEQSSLEGALKCLRSLPHSYGVNYMLADSTRVVSAEASKNDVVSYYTTNGKPYVAHTNHALRSGDLMPYGDHFDGRNSTTSPSIANTVERLSSVTEAIESGLDAFDHRAASALLKAHPVRVAADNGSEFVTLQSMIAEFGDEISMLVSAPTLSDQYQTYRIADVRSTDASRARLGESR